MAVLGCKGKKNAGSEAVRQAAQGNAALAEAYVAKMSKGATIPGQDRTFIREDLARWRALQAKAPDNAEVAKHLADAEAYVSRMEKGQTTPVEDRERVRSTVAGWRMLDTP